MLDCSYPSDQVINTQTFSAQEVSRVIYFPQGVFAFASSPFMLKHVLFILFFDTPTLCLLATNQFLAVAPCVGVLKR